MNSKLHLAIFVGCQRSAVTFVELMVACVLIGSLASFVVPIISRIDDVSQSARLHQIAVEELANQMDRITLRAWDEITAASLADTKLSANALTQLDDPRLEVDVKTESESKRIRLELTWKGRAGELVAPLRLVTWVFENRRML
jgi:type II secretory pathway pseudopilin PulG